MSPLEDRRWSGGPAPASGGAPSGPVGVRSDGPSGARGDLDSRSDVHDLVVGFYRELVLDDLLAPVFDEVAEVDWAEHIPRLIDYWCRVLLGEPGYDGGSIVAAHRHVHEQSPFGAAHYQRWLGLFTAQVDRGWAGPGAERAKAHAHRIAASLARQLDRAPCRPTPGAARSVTADQGATPT